MISQKRPKFAFNYFSRIFLFDLYNLSVNAWLFAPFFHAVKGVNFFRIAYLFKIRIQLILKKKSNIK